MLLDKRTPSRVYRPVSRRSLASLSIVVALLSWNSVCLGQASSAKAIGTIKSIAGNAITMASDAGAVLNVSVEENAKVLRIEPGAKDLKGAEAIQLQDLQVGDRILAVGKPSDDGRSVAATSVIAMKKADVVSTQDRERQEWQRHGVGGLVTAVDPTTGAITISTQSFAGSKSVVIRTRKETILRRYATDSVKFDDAKPAPIDQIKPGDQLRARGTRSSEGNELAADEIVSGTFRNIAGTVSFVNAAANTIGVTDLATKKLVTVKINGESQLRKLPLPLAQAMAVRLKGGSGPGASTEGAGPRSAGDSAAPAPAPSGGAPPSGGARPRGERGPGQGGDLQQMLSRVPALAPADLQKGDALMIVSTEGDGSGAVTAITLVAGVEPILSASPNGGQSMILPPWSFEAPAGGEGGQ